ncbi:hypothetical protein [Oceanobacillus sp. FSL K6-0127]|uniref:hypothetical protein n=1 Tax=Oceanobacillus sp. FSL K6-0127 TaxID=2921420 RepID=UPI0030ECEF80
MNIDKAKRTIEELTKYVCLTENYSVDTFEKRVIREYALSGSIAKVTNKLNSEGYTIKQSEISTILHSKPNDELHKMVRRYLKAKIKHRY